MLSPTSPDSSAIDSLSVKEVLKKPPRLHSSRPSNLLGSFEESVLNGRLEPVSTVHGFKTEICASGSFCPRHLVLPVTVFFYTVNDNDKASSPYMVIQIYLFFFRYLQLINSFPFKKYLGPYKSGQEGL